MRGRGSRLMKPAGEGAQVSGLLLYPFQAPGVSTPAQLRGPKEGGAVILGLEGAELWAIKGASPSTRAL